MAESQTSEIWRVANIRSPIYARSGRRRRRAGRRAEPARASPGCRAGVDRFTNYRPKLGRRPPLYRPGFARLPLVYGRGAGRFLITSFRRAPPEPRPKCDRYISSKKYARLPGEFEIRRRSGDIQFRRRSLDMWRSCITCTVSRTPRSNTWVPCPNWNVFVLKFVTRFIEVGENG